MAAGRKRQQYDTPLITSGPNERRQKDIRAYSGTEHPFEMPGPGN